MPPEIFASANIPLWYKLFCILPDIWVSPNSPHAYGNLCLSRYMVTVDNALLHGFMGQKKRGHWVEPERFLYESMYKYSSFSKSDSSTILFLPTTSYNTFRTFFIAFGCFNFKRFERIQSIEATSMSCKGNHCNLISIIRV